MIRILLGTLLLFAWVPAFFSGAEAQGRNCSIVGTFFVDKSGPENEAMVDMMAFTATSASVKLEKAITDQIEIDGCAVIVVEDSKLETAAAIVIEPVANSKSKVSSNLVILEIDKSKPGCENVAALDVESRIDLCAEHSTTYFINEASLAMAAVRAAKESLEQTFATSRTSVLDQALKTYGLEAPALKVGESLMSMKYSTAASGLVLRANGYIPKLFTAELWERRLPVDARAEKIVGSLLFLNGLGKAFVDRNLGGPKVVDLKDFVRPSIGTLMGYDLLSDLTDAMEKEGYTYSPGWTTR